MLTAYTDGGANLKKHGIGAWAYLVEGDGVSETRAGAAVHTTNNRMEMTAVLRAIRALPKGKPARIVSDSQYVIKGITEWSKTWVRFNWRTADGKPVANRDLWEELLSEIDGRDLAFVHVKGHSGHPQNELVDQLCTAQMQAALALYAEDPQLVRHDPGCPTRRAA